MIDARHRVREIREMGLGKALFRLSWETRSRLHLIGRVAAMRASKDAREIGASSAAVEWPRRLPWADASSVAAAMAERVPVASLAALHADASAAMEGRICTFGATWRDYGNPPAWHLNPVTHEHWRAHVHWTRAFADESRVGDIKQTWELARFPHALLMSRSAAFAPERAEVLAAALSKHISAFIDSSPLGSGIHWSSGQEVAIRVCVWAFAFDALLSTSVQRAHSQSVLLQYMILAGHHLEAVIDYSRYAVFNNHLIAEALTLYAVGNLVPSCARAQRWRDLGRKLLDASACRQFYDDGGYLQASHNYHRVVLQYFSLAVALARAHGQCPSEAWLRALDSSAEFLVAQQNPADGSLPNYGANDGAYPLKLSTCAFSDFRPTLQLAAGIARGERLYEPGPWDEEVAWLMGPRALDLPLRPKRARSRSFPMAGMHVLRGEGPGTFATMRCGSVLSPFSQIDMLHVDLWWRGTNVLVDAGSYRYNGSPEWHAHFSRTASHNTVVVDRRDQMVPFRRFRNLYPTVARTLQFREEAGYTVSVGEHEGYASRPAPVVHRRALVQCRGDLWCVVDTLLGEGDHEARLHWLAAPLAHRLLCDGTLFELQTDAGALYVRIFSSQGTPLAIDVVAGQATPPRGWLSRHYATKEPAPSMAVVLKGRLPLQFITVIAPSAPSALVENDTLSIHTDRLTAQLVLADGIPREVRLNGIPGARV